MSDEESERRASLLRVFGGWSGMHMFTILVTAVRLGHRWRRGQLWWDDFWIGTTSLLSVAIMVNYFNLSLKDIESFSYPSRVYFTWSSYLTTPWLIWCARASILLSIVRIQPPGIHKRITQASFLFFIAAFISITLSVTFMCGVPVPGLLKCEMPRETTSVTLSFQLLGTTWLICWPMFLLSKWTRIPLTERRIVMACFGSGILLIAMDVWHAVNLISVEILGRITMWLVLNASGNLASTLSVLCANSLVLVPYLYRKLLRKEPEPRRPPSDEESSEPTSGSTAPTATSGNATNTTSAQSRYTSTTGDSTGIYSTIDPHITTGINFSQPSSDLTRTSYGDSEKKEVHAIGLDDSFEDSEKSQPRR